MLYLKWFLIVTVVMTTITHSVSERGINWWPDSVAVGSFFGALVIFWMWRIRLQRKGNEHFANAMQATRDLGGK